MEEHVRFMQMAIELATSNVRSGHGGPFGALIVSDGVVLATGVNQVAITNDPTAHAEVIAIRNACKAISGFELKGCTIYSSCEPCPMCLAAILWSRCSSLFFGNTALDAAEAGFDDAHLYEQIRLQVNERELRSTNLVRDQALVSFAEWRAFAGKIPY